MYEATHTQLELSVLALGDIEFAGHGVQAAGPTTGLYVLLLQAMHVSPFGPE